jgi:hypothetical protein
VKHDGQYEVIEKCFDAEQELNTQVFEGQLENFRSTQS